MRVSAALLPILAAPCLVAQPSPEWEKTLAQLKQNLSKRPGFGAAVLVERLDSLSVRIRLQLLGASVREASFSGQLADGASQGVPIHIVTPKGMESINTTAMLNEFAYLLEIRLKGDEFSPTLRVRVPKQGEKAEVAMLSVETPAK
jgi:hypothetical protein